MFSLPANCYYRADIPPRTPVLSGQIRQIYTQDGDTAEALRQAMRQPDAQSALHEQMLTTSLAFWCSEMMRGPDEAPFLGRFVICRHHVEMDKAVRESKRVLIRAARGHSKSETFSVGYPIWKADRNLPGGLFYIFSGSQTLAEERLEETKKQLDRNPKLSHLLPSEQERKDGRKFTWNQREINLISKGRKTTIRARGCGVRVRGGHPHGIVCDDLLDDDCLYSETRRRKAAEYFFSVPTNMINPVMGQIIVIGCVQRDTYVTTLNGLRRISELDQGSERKLEYLDLPIETKDGTGKAVCYWKNGECKTKNVTLEKGIKLEGSLVHPVWVMGNDGVPGWRKLPELKIDDYVAVRVGAERWGERISLDDFRPKNETNRYSHCFRNGFDHDGYLGVDLAYLLGLWTAEGSYEKTGRVAISNTEPCIQKWLKSAPCGMRFEYNSSTSPQTARYSCKRFLQLIEWLGGRLGTAPRKKIPERIMSADRETVVEFLRGLLDGDGGAYHARDGYRVTLASTSEELIRQAQQLMINLGILGGISKRRLAKSDRVKNPKYPCWCLHISGDDARKYLTDVGFRIERKQLLPRTQSRTTVMRGIPHQCALVRAARKEKRRRRKGTGGQTFNITGRLEKQRPSIAFVQKALDWLLDSGASGPATSALVKNMETANRFAWLRVKSVEDGFADTRDFVVPDDNSFISNGIVSHNTPFVQGDLYDKIKETGEYICLDFPARDAAGTPLFPERYSAAALKKKEREIGPARFSREFLVSPVTDLSSLFPSHLFDGTDIRLPYRLGLPYSYWEERGCVLYSGVDIAMSAEVGADYFVIFTIAVDQSGVRWIANIVRERGVGFDRQLQYLEEEHALMRPDCFYIEANQAQRFVPQEMIRRTNVPIRYFFTTGRDPKQPWTKGMTTLTANKHNLDRGVPSLRMGLENRKWRIPRGDERSIELTDLWMGELQCISFEDGKIVSAGEHDDIAMASWFCDSGAKHGGAQWEIPGVSDSEEKEQSKDILAAPSPRQIAVNEPDPMDIEELKREMEEADFDPFGLGKDFFGG